MYKTYIKQWGLDKKNKEPEMRAIVRKNQQRANQGKRSIIHVRGRHRDFAEVVDYWARKGISIDDIVARQKASPTPEAVVFSTPIPSPIMTPEVLAVPERILRCIQDYFKGSFESGTWIRTEPTIRCYSRKQGDCSEPLFQFREYCSLACSFFKRNLFLEAGQKLLHASACIELILLEEDPWSLLCIFNEVLHIRRRKRNEVSLIMLRQFSALGRVLLGSEHPLSRIYEWCEAVSASDYEEIFIRCIIKMTDSFDHFLGPMHWSTLLARARSIKIQAYERSACLQMLQNLLGKCENILQPLDTRMMWIRRRLATWFLAGGQYAEANSLCQKNISYSQDRTNDDTYEQASDLYVVACCQYALGEVDLGIVTLGRVIDLEVSNYGQRDARLPSRLLQLQDWLVEQGHWEVAGQVRDWILKILESTVD